MGAEDCWRAGDLKLNYDTVLCCCLLLATVGEGGRFEIKL